MRLICQSTATILCTILTHIYICDATRQKLIYIFMNGETTADYRHIQLRILFRNLALSSFCQQAAMVLPAQRCSKTFLIVTER